mmetsp:Transcript_21177/g.25961  ORF Transcript_21177/g.25961 Transcript_21177/m.25961 type:complete len:105 (-) Transcript_21177:79-393(-)
MSLTHAQDITNDTNMHVAVTTWSQMVVVRFVVAMTGAILSPFGGIVGAVGSFSSNILFLTQRKHPKKWMLNNGITILSFAFWKLYSSFDNKYVVGESKNLKRPK